LIEAGPLYRRSNLTPALSNTAIGVEGRPRVNAAVRNTTLERRAYWRGIVRRPKERPVHSSQELLPVGGFEDKRGVHPLGLGLQHGIGCRTENKGCHVWSGGLAAKDEMKTVVFLQAEFCDEQRGRVLVDEGSPFQKVLCDRDVESAIGQSRDGEPGISERRLDDDSGKVTLGMCAGRVA
jgi:hypothetical protein